MRFPFASPGSSRPPGETIPAVASRFEWLLRSHCGTPTGLVSAVRYHEISRAAPPQCCLRLCDARPGGI